MDDEIELMRFDHLVDRVKVNPSHWGYLNMAMYFTYVTKTHYFNIGLNKWISFDLGTRDNVSGHFKEWLADSRFKEHARRAWEKMNYDHTSLEVCW